MSFLKNKFSQLYSHLHKKYHHLHYGNCAILLYHRVTNYETDPQLLCVSPKNFNDQLQILKNKYNVLTIEELTSYLTSNKKIPKNSVAITFDDGYADNYLEALPILEKHKLQALFYVMTGNLNSEEEYWWDKMERIFLLSNKPSVYQFEFKDQIFDISDWNQKNREKIYNDLLPLLRRMNSKERDLIIKNFEHIFNVIPNRPSHRAMSFDELKKMHTSESAVIGIHTNLHPSLGSLSYEEQLFEINTSKNILERELSEKIDHFSYPFGTNSDFNDDTINICKTLKISVAAANYPAIANKRSDKYRFPRFLVRDWEADVFEKKVESFFK